jgi:glucose/arabinose dehydrogenase
MAFYSGSDFPAWKGDVLVGALAGMELRRVILDGERVRGQTSYLKGWKRIRDLRVTADGRVYVLSDGESGAMWRLRPR